MVLGLYVILGSMSQAEDMSIVIDGYDILNTLECLPLTHARRRYIDKSFNFVEKRAFASINCAVGWLGTTTSLFCSMFAFLIEQATPTAVMCDLVAQTNGLCRLRKLGTGTLYLSPDCKLNGLPVVLITDAEMNHEKGQLSYVVSLVLDDLALGSIFNLLSCSFH